MIIYLELLMMKRIKSAASLKNLTDTYNVSHATLKECSAKEI